MKPFRTIQWLSAMPGLVLVLLGLSAVFWPAAIVGFLPVLIGVLFLAFGIVWVTDGMHGRRAVNPLGLPRIVQGGISIAAGCVFVFNRSLSVLFLGVVLGIWMLASGVYSLRKAALRRQSTPYYRFSCVDGVLKILLGAVMLWYPFGTMSMWAVAAGVICFLTGVSMLVSAFYLYRFFGD